MKKLTVSFHRVKHVLMLVMIMAALLVPNMVTFAQESTPAVDLDIDVGPLFDNIETFLPVFFSILAIAGGIAIAVALAKFIINAILSGFEGRSL